MDGFSKKFIIHQIIWTSIAFSIVIFAAMPYISPELLKNKGSFLPETFLYALAGSFSAGSFLTKKIFLNVFSLAKNLKGQDNIEEKILNILLIPNLISWSLNESIAILGFVNTIATGNHLLSLNLIGIGFACHLMTFPNQERAKQLIQEIKNKML